MKSAKIFAPRRQPLTVDGIHDSETILSLRSRIKQMWNCASQSDVLLLHGEMLNDSDTVGSKFENDEEVLFFTEITAPAQDAAGGVSRSMRQAPAVQGLQPNVAGGGGRPITAADIANLFQRPAVQAAPTRNPTPAARPTPPAAQPSTVSRGAAAVPTQLVRELVEMGFNEHKARTALRRNHNSIEEAVDWLSEHWDQPDSFYEESNDPPPPPPPSAPAAPAAPAAVAATLAPNPAPTPEARQYAEIFDPVLRAAALVALGDSRPDRVALELTRLPAIEADGWRGIRAAVLRIWAGERDDAALTASLDANTSFLVRRVLELVRSGAAACAAAAAGPGGELDFHVRRALPRDARAEAMLAPLRPWILRLARSAVRKTAQAMGDEVPAAAAAGSPAEEEKEDEAVDRFVAGLDAKGWQLRAALDMLSAGVRSEVDVLECVAPRADGRPDDNSLRLVHAVMEDIARF